MKKLIKEFLLPVYEFVCVNFIQKKINIDNSKQNIYLFLCADYGNIGDVAIVMAEKKYLKRKYPKANIVEIPVTETYFVSKQIKKKFKKEDIITLIGGGSYGTLYPRADYHRAFIVRYFNEKRIFSFPQTVVFENTKYGKRRLEKNQKAISRSKDITLFAREKKSYEFMKDNFSCKTYLVPDIVLSMNTDYNNKRNNIVLSFRKDNERKITKKEKEILIKIVKDTKIKILELDTTVEDFDYEKREDCFLKITTEYSRAKLVITDRLHGMIFSFITNTPCIVLSNNNHKIEETYSTWLKKANFIVFIKEYNIEKINEEILRFTSDSFKINKIDLKKDYKFLDDYLN